MALDHEQVVVRRGERSGLYCVIAVHSTALGPALGGLRIWHYPDQSDALRDAMRLAAGMTLKAAAAGLDLGGGKGVICAPADGLEGERRQATRCSTSATWSSRSTAATSPPRTSARRRPT